jgi:hypothetical protein
MKIDQYGFCASLVLLGCAAGCAGNGDGLDQNGQPVSLGSGSSSSCTASPSCPTMPTFESIQATVFTPICSKCHIGSSAPEGLQLDAAHSYNLLVGVPSTEQPNVLRVKPGDPTDSYMVRKIEGVMGVDAISGGQMPLGETPLPQENIDAIAQWVMNGAPNAPAAAAAQALAVQTTAPLDQSVVAASPAHIVVTFTKEVDASLVNRTTVMLERIGAAGDAGESTDSGSGSAAAPAASTVPAVAALAPSNAAVLLITPAAALGTGAYRVTVRGTGPGALADMNAAALGADLSFTFTVEPPR